MLLLFRLLISFCCLDDDEDVEWTVHFAGNSTFFIARFEKHDEADDVLKIALKV